MEFSKELKNMGLLINHLQNEKVKLDVEISNKRQLLSEKLNALNIEDYRPIPFGEKVEVFKHHLDHYDHKEEWVYVDISLGFAIAQRAFARLAGKDIQIVYYLYKINDSGEASRFRFQPDMAAETRHGDYPFFIKRLKY